MEDGDIMVAIRRDLPGEFWADLDDIVRLLTASIAATEARVAEMTASIAHLSDNELRLSLNSLPAEARPCLFSFRKAGAVTGKSRESLMRSRRSTGNVLAVYVPSYAMERGSTTLPLNPGSSQGDSSPFIFPKRCLPDSRRYAFRQGAVNDHSSSPTSDGYGLQCRRDTATPLSVHQSKVHNTL